MKLKNFYLVAAMMAAPVASSAADYYISTEARGNGDGSSWDNAMAFSTMLDQINSFANGDVFYFAGGKYNVPKVVTITNGYTFVGGFNPELTGTGHETPDYPSAIPTVFSGDINGDGVANSGDAECLLSFKTNTKNGDESKKVVLKGLELTGAYSQSSPSDNATARGALHLDNCGYVEVDDCRFYGNVAEEPAEGNAKQVGGMAFTSHRSLSVFNGCEFTDNKATSRGGAIKLTSDNKEKGKTTFNRCLIARNTIKNDLGSAICMQHGAYLQIVNSTVTDNVAPEAESAIYATGTDGNHNRYVYVVNSTIAGNEGGAQIEMTSDANIFVANSIIVSGEGTPALAVTATEPKVSGGMNILGPGASDVLTLQDSDNASAENSYSAIFGENELGANGVIEPLAEDGKYDAAALSAAIADWGILADVTVDQTGAVREEGSTAGAYAKKTGSTGITGWETENGHASDAYYTLQGIKLGSRPTAAGIYIHNGKKFIIR